ncbi:hypothetical protein [Paenibacillus arenosi]|uniref:Phage protein n=1 Tax=Paenibacillus arenosi TaxID=2774142 RepID=A0ABR9AXJ5_9BACL|nr:hypothetical protein [Paenibacillus arenosi]MBD8498865.1 hypothetical protein [Paenibacillus arenosi]
MSALMKKWIVTACFLTQARPNVEFMMDSKPTVQQLEHIRELNRADWLEVLERYYPASGE